MDTMDKTQKLNRTIPCENCGEMYSISYKRCPFCGGSGRKRDIAAQAVEKIVMPESLREEAAPPQQMAPRPAPRIDIAPPASSLRDEDELPQPEDFSPDMDWTPILDDGAPEPITGKGGKRLAKGGGGGGGRILLRVIVTLLSLALVVAAAYIVWTKVVPLVQERFFDKPAIAEEKDKENGEPPVDDTKKEETPPAETAFRLLDLKLSLNQKDETKTLTPIYEGEGEMGAVSWKSSDPAVVTVSSEGKLTAVKPGTATITATRKADDTTATCAVTCIWDESAPAQLSLNKVDFTLGKNDPSVTLKVIGTDQAVTWASKDDGIASISESGVVKYIGPGTVTVTATVGSQTLSCVVRCK